MSEQVVVICSAGEQRSAMDICSKLETQGLTCWSPVREEDPDAAIWTLPSKLRSARAMILVTADQTGHAEEIEVAAGAGLPVIIAPPDAKSTGWKSVLLELADALGLSTEWIPSGTSPGSVPKTHIAEDEEEFLEFIAENVSEAQVFVRFGIFDRAVQRLHTVFAKAPRNLEAHDELLKIHLETEEWKKAAGTAADFLDCLRYRGDLESYAILRAHLGTMGFTVDDGPPVAVGYSDVEPVPTKFFESGSKAPPAPTPTPAPASSSATPHMSKPPEPVPLELPALRNFKSSNPVFQSSGVDSELSGVDFFLEHGMLDEARMRLAQLEQENPGHPGVSERMRRIESLGLLRVGPAIALELDDPWDAAARSTHEVPVDAFLGSSGSATGAQAASPNAAPGGAGDSLVCTASVPESVGVGDMFTIRVCIHLPGQTDHPTLDTPHDRRESNMLAINVQQGEPLEFSLDLPGLEVEYGHRRIQWTGASDEVEFGVFVPFGISSGIVSGRLSVRSTAGSAGDFTVTVPVA